MQYVLAFLIFFVSMWAFFFAGSRFIDFCDDHNDRWWGGFPLWMAGGLGVLLPLFVGAVVLSIYIAVGEHL